MQNCNSKLKIIFKPIFVFVIFSVILLSQAGFVLADDPTIPKFTKYDTFEELLNKITDYIFYIAVIVAPLMIVIGAFIFMTSAGDPNRSTLGKNIIKWAAIGLAIILFAKGISGVVRQIVTG